MWGSGGGGGVREIILTSIKKRMTVTKVASKKSKTVTAMTHRQRVSRRTVTTNTDIPTRSEEKKSPQQ